MCVRAVKWSSCGERADGTEFTVKGKYLEVDPPRLLVHTWNRTIRACTKWLCAGSWNHESSSESLRYT